MSAEPAKRIGVLLCDCEGAIAGRLDLDKVQEALSASKEFAYVGRHAYLCGEEGMDVLNRAIKDEKLDGIVVAACEAGVHQSHFVPVAKACGLEREACLNVDLRQPTERYREEVPQQNAVGARPAEGDAAAAVKQVVDKIKDSAKSLTGAAQAPAEGDVVKRALIVGGGIAGIQAALDIADAGYPVTLVERNPSIGGHMIQLSETFPTLDCSQCIMTPKMVECGRHPNIEILAYSEVEEITGEPGRFKAKIRKKPRYVEADKCTACGDCVKDCPVLVTDQYNTGMAWRKAIYSPFPQAVPATYTLDEENCLGLFPIACGKCATSCKPGAINYDQKPRIVEREAGAVIMATGFELYSHENIGEYGYGKFPDVVNGLQFERLLSASGPTMGKVKRPSDGKEPKEVVFIQCVRSRDPERGMPYCSKICCMYTAKHAMLYKHRVHDGQAYVFYMDIRAGGKGYEEFVQRAVEEDGVVYLRGRVSRVFQEEGKVVVWGVDTLTGRNVEIAADMVVLASAIVPNDGSEIINKIAGAKTDEHGFLTEADMKVHPVECPRPGFYLAGAAQGPKDIPETVAQASGAASKVCSFFAGGGEPAPEEAAGAAGEGEAGAEKEKAAVAEKS